MERDGQRQAEPFAQVREDLELLGEGLQQPLFSLPELLLPVLPGLIAVGIMLLLDSRIPWLGACSWGSLLVHTALLFLIFSASVICGYFPASKKN